MAVTNLPATSSVSKLSELSDVVLISPSSDHVIYSDGLGGFINKPITKTFGMSVNTPDFDVANGAAFNSIAMGSSAQSSGASSISFGKDSTAGSTNSIAIGQLSAANVGASNIAIGDQAHSFGSGGSIAVGELSESLALRSVAVGLRTQSTHDYAVVLGAQLSSTVVNEVKIGNPTNTLVLNGTGALNLVGTTAQYVVPNYASGLEPIGIAGGVIFDSTNAQLMLSDGSTWSAVGGAGGDPYVLTNYDGNVPILTGADSMCVGEFSQATGIRTVSIGRLTKATGNYSVAIGNDANSSASSALSLGNSANARSTDSAAIGKSCTTSKIDSVTLGANSHNNLYRGNGACVSLGSAANPMHTGTQSFAAGRSSIAGDSQYNVTMMRTKTLDATPLLLGTGGTGASPNPTDRFITTDQTLYDVEATVIGKSKDTTSLATAVYKFSFAMLRDVGVGSLSLLTADVGKLVVYESDIALDVNITLNTTTGELDINCTGLTGITINWVCSLRYTTQFSGI